ncbi:squalene synthase HpnC [Saccharopolyspora sp. TS4A08]|uniref:Squalene synthase HpnC n=1 Tax=Saccharopolyspora ipomoeae TaxID=3042027 RepID=A0ABT6PQ11_9PSEU|nr:squalene synthase HpnC [Saccharopolyspora sp. TS4A08]MDI2029531.1 squalene synthase HpnC [Saccharopolyspora sp. TS4A08]
MVLSLPDETLSGEDPEHPEGSGRSGEFPRSAAVLARMRSENFPVASRVLPRGVRRHLHALYGYFRLVDYAGDEAPGNREALLDFLEHDLERAYAGSARLPLMRGLQETVAECAIPVSTLAKLIEANRRDQHVKRYADFAELLDYCALSANPVGESVLHVFGRAEEGLIALSDRVCTALQILEHLQDLAEDHRAGRIYVPAEDLARYGCQELDLAAPRASTALRGLVRFEVERARRMLRDGSVLVGALSGTARVAVAGYVGGGLATVAAFAAAGHDPLAAPVSPSRSRTFAEWARLHAMGGTR